MGNKSKQGSKKPSRISTGASWKKAGVTTLTQAPLELPSGTIVMVQPLGVPELLKRGLVPNPLIQVMLDVLEISDTRMTSASPAAVKKVEKQQREKLQQSMATMIEDPEKFIALMTMVDNITVACVIEPRVYPVPTAPEGGELPERDEDLVYVDEIPEDDKFYVMSHAMSGVRDLEGFRGELASVVDTSSNGDSASSEAE